MEKNLEDMNRDDRQQYVDTLNRQAKEWREKVPILNLTPEQAAACRHPNQAELERYLKKSHVDGQRRMQKWVEKGGSPDDLD